MKKKYFSIIASVYGVEKYLDEFFVSIINQSIGFEDNIEIIVVNDGSLDSSVDIIRRWQNYYPENIKYVYKKNGGLSSARNEGLKYVSTSWVSFIDPDDFVNNVYFEIVDSFLKSHQKDTFSVVSCNHIFYMEASNRFSDTHPLSFRFRERETILEVPDLGDYFQLAVNTLFLRTEVIRKHSLLMDLRVKPTFEDAHFFGRYLLEISGKKIAFLREAKYYYRKRQDNSSLIDSSWENVEHYTSKLKYGYLDLLLTTKTRFNKIPLHTQRTVLYDMFWYVQYILNQSERLDFLNPDEKTVFLCRIKEIFSHIDTEAINHFNIAGCWFLHKVGMLGCFKGVSPQSQIVYAWGYDVDKNLLQLKYYYHGSLPPEFFELGEREVQPIFSKSRTYSFLEETFVKERIIWLPIGLPSEKLVTNIGNGKTQIFFSKKHHHEAVVVEDILSSFNKPSLADGNFPVSIRLLRALAVSKVASEPYNNTWVFMDRDTQADDNAEHLYRYVIKSHSHINAYFVLRRSSHDWDRLEQEGFKLLDFNSRDHHLALLNADHLISSHADHYVVSLLESKWFSDLLTYRYTFLQHGVTQNDLSNWLNSKTIDLFITVTKQEFNSISGDDNRYKYTEKEVVLSGFPRHDHLLKMNAEIATEKLIIIMPTWRQKIVGVGGGQGNNKEINDLFYSSDYAMSWKSLLNSQVLKEHAEMYGYKIIFFPHANIEPYIDWFESPDYIYTVAHNSSESIQDLFCRASLLITDYSSVAFDMAFLDKPVIYYQFDYDFVFGGGHTTSKGYYDYHDNGFGPVCMNEEDLLSLLIESLERDTPLEKKYRKRIGDTFLYRDGLCCQRVYEAIEMLKSNRALEKSPESSCIKYLSSFFG